MASAAWSPLPWQSEPLEARAQIYGHPRFRLPCSVLDASNTVNGFSGRDEIISKIDKILLVLYNAKLMQELRVVALCGMGGMGMFTVVYVFK
jgi:hypothetical protein